MFFNNYRPISLLSVFSKIIERLMYSRLLNFINKHKIFNKLQFGFRNNHSTFMALVILVENLVNALDNGKCAVGIFLDFQEAFDTVDHCILLDKLYCYGIRGIQHEWFISYLSSRQQSVMYNGHEEMAKIYAWVNANKLSLNIDKNNFIMFMPKGFSYCADYIVINQTRIQEVKETKFLGVITDNQLKWSAHISYISKKISKCIGIILKSRKVFSNETLLSLYHTFVYPYLSYCIHVWGKAYKTHLNDLVVLQNKAMRIINGVPPRTNMDNFYIENNILTAKHIYNYNIGLFMYKYVNKMTPDVFDNFFSSISDIHQYETRNATMKLLYITFRGTTRGQKDFKYLSPRIWNFIIKNINPSCPISSFKTHYRQLFLAAGDDVM